MPNANSRPAVSDPALVPRSGFLQIGTWRLELEQAAPGSQALRWSDETFRIFGYAPGQIALTNATFFEHVHPEDHEAVRTAMARAIEGSGDYAVEHRIIRPDGQVRLLHEHGSIERDALSGRPLRVHGTVQDITERAISERELHAALETLAAERTSALQRALAIHTTLSEGAPEPIWLHEPGKGITYVNRRWCELFGKTPKDWMGDAWMDLLHPDDAPGYLAFWKDATQLGQTFHAEARFRDTTGAMLSFDVKCAPVHEADGSILAWVGIHTDITPLKRHEEALSQANRELASFSYSVSHDLRAPLRAIDGFSRLLLEESGAVLDERSRGYLDRVRRSAHQMGVLIDDLLEFSRLGRRALRFTAVDHAALVASVLASIEEDREEREITWRIGALPVGRGDRSLLRQVWTNLLSNAVKFTRMRPEAIIEVGTEPSESGTTFFVRDNGVGFDMLYAERLFGVFQRLHRAEEFPGTGVGLAIVSRIVERHGGSVRAEGVLDTGACFRFTLPDNPPATALEPGG